MKKRVFGRHLSRERDTRRALFRSLMRALIINGKIKTTKAKAKAIQADVDKMISLANKEDVASRRRLYSLLANDRLIADYVVRKVITAFAGKNSGFTRVIKLPRRVGDNAEMVRLEWSSEVEKYEISAKGNRKEKAKVKNKVDAKKEDEKNKGILSKGKNLLRRRK